MVLITILIKYTYSFCGGSKKYFGNISKEGIYYNMLYNYLEKNQSTTKSLNL